MNRLGLLALFVMCVMADLIALAWMLVAIVAGSSRALRYRNEADPPFFKYQRGEIEREVWLNKAQEIKSRYPK